MLFHDSGTVLTPPSSNLLERCFTRQHRHFHPLDSAIQTRYPIDLTVATNPLQGRSRTAGSLTVIDVGELSATPTNTQFANSPICGRSTVSVLAISSISCL